MEFFHEIVFCGKNIIDRKERDKIGVGIAFLSGVWNEKDIGNWV